MKRVFMLGLIAIIAISLSADFERTNNYELTISELGEHFLSDSISSVESKKYVARHNARWSEISRIWGRGDDALVRDIETGRTFALRRTFGTNHADVEPLTKEDADTMYNIWGGWSWSRRAVLVYVDGYVFAGSLTNFPHAGLDRYPALKTVNARSGGFGRGLNFDAVKGNGVDGHMCLHFAGSALHSNGRASANHQRMVQVAIAYLQNSDKYVQERVD